MPGMMQMTGPPVFDSPSPAKHHEHALRSTLPYHDITSAGWQPKEAATKPTADMVGAGYISHGSIDNTYLVAPLKNAWGKSRALMRNEHRVTPYKQATDLLVVAKGYGNPPPHQTLDHMKTVLEPYSPPVPLFHQMDPLRLEGGFVRGPNMSPGAAPSPRSVMRTREYIRESMKSLPSNHKEAKMKYEEYLASTSALPVSRTYRSFSARPVSAQPRWCRVPAGLPGGLSLNVTTE